MAVVAGVLLDHVAEDPSDAGRLNVGRRAPDGTAEPVGLEHFFERGPGALDVLLPQRPQILRVSPAECHSQSEPQSSESHGTPMSRPRSW